MPMMGVMMPGNGQTNPRASIATTTCGTNLILCRICLGTPHCQPSDCVGISSCGNRAAATLSLAVEHGNQCAQSGRRVQDRHRC